MGICDEDRDNVKEKQEKKMQKNFKVIISLN